MVILEFTIFLLQDSYQSITNQFINHIYGLRFLIIKFKGDYLEISDEEIDSDIVCNSLLNKYVASESENLEKINVFL